MAKSIGISNNQQKWVLDYIDAYKRAKLSNQYTVEVQQYIEEHNSNAVSFYTWYNQFRTVRTELSGRKDIDIYYWIDGLGVDWVPFIVQLIEKYKMKMYL